jgi:flagellar hook-associated protein 1 FlgK
MASLFNIGVSGLRAQQTALAVTGQNITNASTPGYSRQRVEITTQTSGVSGAAFQGGGARLDAIARIADSFATNQIRLDTSLFSELDSLSQQIAQVEGMLLDETSGLDVALQGFFSALQTASSNPSDLPNRQLVLSSAVSLAQRFQGLHERLSDQLSNVTGVLQSAAARVNEIASGIAELNSRIAALDASNENGSSNSLLDQRDELLRELSTYASVSTNVQHDGQVSVFIGKGQPIVLGADASRLEVTPKGEIAIRPDARSERLVITSALQGGEMGGVLQFRDQVLLPSMNQLGRLAHAVTASVNEVHQGGIDLNGELGGLLFQDLNEPLLTTLRASADENNTTLNPGSVRVTIDDPFAVPLSNYELTFDEATPGAYFVKRLDDGALVFQGSFDGNLPVSIQFDHLTVELDGGDFLPGDSYVLKPLADAAGSFSVVMHDPGRLAFASPVRADTAAGNVGSGEISVGEVFDRDHSIFGQPGSLTPPLLVRFLSPTSYEVLDNSDPANPVALNPPLTQLPYDPRTLNELLPDSPGQTIVRFDGTDVARLPGAPTVLSGLGALGNGYGAQTINLTQRDPLTGSVMQVQNLALAADSSARAIAAQLATLSGVKTSAITELQITDLVSNGLGDDLSIAVNGIALGAVSSLNELADAISANPQLQTMGITARSDGATLTLSSTVGDDLSVQVAGDLTDSVTLRGANGQALQVSGAGPSGDYRTVSVGGTVTAMLAEDMTLSSTSSAVLEGNPTHARADFGFGLQMTGAPVAGDTFAIGYNTSGVGDNRNALQLAGLNLKKLIGDPPATFSDTYGQLVQFVGIQSSQSQINRDAASSLLEQSIAQRESISGVNLDEEAANLIRFEQAYNASAQIISVARDIFNVLFNVVS